MTLLIVGSTGTLGRQLVRKALEAGFNIRCIVRNKQKSVFLQNWGAELIYGDLIFPETLPLSFQGVSAVIDVSTTKSNDENNTIDVDWSGKLILIELSKRMNIKRFIFFSILNAEKYLYISLLQMKTKIEELLKSSGICYTIFKCAGFYQGLIDQYALPILEKKTIWLTTEFTKISYIDTQDAAQFCVQSLFISKTENQTYFLGNEKTWISKDLISLCEKFAGQKAKVKIIPLSVLKIIRQITSFFQWTNKISERLGFIEVLANNDDLNFSSSNLYETFNISSNKFFPLEVYLREYYGFMLLSLENL